MSAEKQDDRRKSEPSSDRYHHSDDRREPYHPRGGYAKSRGPTYESTPYRGRFPRARGTWFERGRGSYVGRGERGAARGEGRGRGYYRGEHGNFNYRGRDAPRGRGHFAYQEEREPNRREYREHYHERYEDDYHYKEPRRSLDDHSHRERRSRSREQGYKEYRDRRDRSGSRDRSREHSKYNRDRSPSRSTSRDGRENSVEREYRKILKRDRRHSRSWSRGRSRSRSRERGRRGSRERSSSQSKTSKSEGSKYSRERSRSWERSKSRERERGKGRRRSRSGSFSRSPSDWRGSQEQYSVSLDQDDSLYGTDQETSEIIRNTFSLFDKVGSKKRHGTSRRSRSRSSESSTEKDRKVKEASLKSSAIGSSNNSIEDVKKPVNTFGTKKTEGLSDMFKDKSRLDEMAKDISIKISVCNPEAKIREDKIHSQEVSERPSSRSTMKTHEKGSKKEKLSLFGALSDLFKDSKASKGEESDSHSHHQEKHKESLKKQRPSAIPGLDSVNNVDEEEEFLYGGLLPTKPLERTEPKKEKKDFLRGSSEMDWETNEPAFATGRNYSGKDAHVIPRKHLETSHETSQPCLSHSKSVHEPVFPVVAHQPPTHPSVTQQCQSGPGQMLPQHVSHHMTEHGATNSHMTGASVPQTSAPVAGSQQMTVSQYLAKVASYLPQSSMQAEVKNLEAIQKANLLSAIHQPGFMDAVNMGRRGERITESDLLAAAKYQQPPVSAAPVQQYSAPQSSAGNTQLQIRDLLQLEQRAEPERPPKPEPSKDNTIENILKSIGFNFELSKMMQEKAEKEKEREAGMKQSVDSFGIKEGSSFLQGGLKNVDIQSVFDKEGSKLKKSAIIPEESYEERARRYMEEQRRSMASHSAVVQQDSQYEQETHQKSPATHSLDYLRTTYEEKHEPTDYQQYDYDNYHYGDQYDYENRQFAEMQQQDKQVSSITVVGGAAASRPSTKPQEVSQSNVHSYYSTTVTSSLDPASDVHGHNKVYSRESTVEDSYRKASEDQMYRDETSYLSYSNVEAREIKTARRRGSSESQSRVYNQSKEAYHREHSQEKIDSKESTGSSDHRGSSLPRASPRIDQKDRYSMEKASPVHQKDDVQGSECQDKKDEPLEKSGVNRNVVTVKGRYRVMEKDRERRDSDDFSPERNAKKPRLQRDHSSSRESLNRKLLEVNVQQEERQEVPHQRRVVMMKPNDDTDNLLSSSKEHRRTVKAHSVERKERMTAEQHSKLKKEMQERKKKLGQLEKELDFLSQEQQDLKQRSQRDGHRDKMMEENIKLQAEIGKQITYLRRAVDDNMKRLNSVEVHSPEREATPKRKLKEEESSGSQTRHSTERSRPERSPEVEETRKVFVEKKRKLDPEIKPVKREKSPAKKDKDEDASRKLKKELKKESKEQFKKVTPNTKRVLRSQPKEEKPNVEDKYVNKRFQLYFDYFDGGEHWCGSCRHLSPTIEVCFEHIQSKKHIKCSEGYDKPWSRRINEKKFPPSIQPVRVPFKGVEFLTSCQAFYCSLCNVFSGDQVIALEHLKSDDHNRKYKIYTDDHPGYEKKLTMDRKAGISIKKNLKSKKKSKKSKKKKKSKKVLPEKEETSKKIQFKVGKTKSLMAPKVEEPPANSSSSESSSSSSSSSSSDSSSDSDGETSGFKKLQLLKKTAPQKSEKSGSSAKQVAGGEAKEVAKRQPFQFPLIGKAPALKGGKINVKMATGSEKKYKSIEEELPKQTPEEPEVILRKKPSKFSGKPAALAPQEEKNEKNGDEEAKKGGKTVDLFFKVETTTGTSVALPVMKEAKPITVPEKTSPVITKTAIASAFAASSSKKPETLAERQQTEEMKMLGLDPSDSTLFQGASAPPPIVLPRKENPKASKERKSFMASSNAAKLYNIFYGGLDKKEEKAPEESDPVISVSSIPMPPMKQWQKPKIKPTPPTVVSSKLASGPIQTVESSNKASQPAQSVVISNQASQLSVVSSDQASGQDVMSSNKALKEAPTVVSSNQAKVVSASISGPESSHSDVAPSVSSGGLGNVTEVLRVQKTSVSTAGQDVHGSALTLRDMGEVKSHDIGQPVLAGMSVSVGNTAASMDAGSGTSDTGKVQTVTESYDISNVVSSTKGSSNNNGISNSLPDAAFSGVTKMTETAPGGVGRSGETLAESERESKNIAEVSAEHCVHIDRNTISSDDTVVVSDRERSFPGLVGMSDTKGSSKLSSNVQSTGNTVIELKGENSSDTTNKEVIANLCPGTTVHGQQVPLKTDHVWNAAEAQQKVPELSTVSTVKTRMIEHSIQVEARDSGICQKLEEGKEEHRINIEQIYGQTVYSSKATDKLTTDNNAESGKIPDAQSRVGEAGRTEVTNTPSYEVTPEEKPALVGDPEEGSLDPDSTTATEKPTEPLVDDTTDFLEITPQPIDSVAKNPKRGSGRGRPPGRGRRGRGRGGRGKYRSRNKSESAPSDESIEEGGERQVEEIPAGSGEFPQGGQSAHSTELTGGQQEGSKTDQSGGKWKALESVSVTSSQAVTLEDIARQSGGDTHAGVDPTENEALAMSGFELLDECSEH